VQGAVCMEVRKHDKGRENTMPGIGQFGLAVLVSRAAPGIRVCSLTGEIDAATVPEPCDVMITEIGARRPSFAQARPAGRSRAAATLPSPSIENSSIE